MPDNIQNNVLVCTVLSLLLTVDCLFEVAGLRASIPGRHIGCDDQAPTLFFLRLNSFFSPQNADHSKLISPVGENQSPGQHHSGQSVVYESVCGACKSLPVIARPLEVLVLSFFSFFHFGPICLPFFDFVPGLSYSSFPLSLSFLCVGQKTLLSTDTTTARVVLGDANK